MKTRKLIALLPLNRFDLPHREGMYLEIEEKQAEVLIEAGYAEEVTEIPAAIQVAEIEVVSEEVASEEIKEPKKK